MICAGARPVFTHCSIAATLSSASTSFSGTGINATYTNLSSNTVYNETHGTGFALNFNTVSTNNLAYNNQIGFSITSNAIAPGLVLTGM